MTTNNPPSPLEVLLKASGVVPAQGTVERQSIVTALVAEGAYEEGDRTFLDSLPADQFGKVLNAAKKLLTSKTIPIPAPAPAVPALTPPVVGNSAATALTPEQWLAMAPPEFKQMYAENQAQQAQRKQQAIEIIVANKANCFTPEYLATMSVPQLEGMAALAGNPTQNSAPSLGHHDVGSPPMFISNPQVNNSGAGNPLPVLKLPQMDFVGKGKKTA